MPEVDAVWRKWAGDSRVLVLTVATGTSERIEMLRAQNQLGVPIAWAPEGWTETVGIRAFPETIFLDAQGRIAERIPHATDEEHLLERLDALVAEAEGQEVAYVPGVEARHSLSSRVFFALEGLLPHPGPARLDPFTWTAKRRGDELIIRLDIPRHTHVSRDAVEVVLTDADGARTIELPAGEISADPAFGDVEQYRADLVLRVPVAPGPARLSVRHQGCADDLCYAPAMAELSVPAAR